MLRTNSKKALANLDKYIMTDKDFLIDDYGVIDWSADIVAVCTAINDAFEDEALKYDKRYKLNRISRFDLFEDWAQGLALGGLFDFYYYPTAKKIVQGILEESEEEANKYTEEQAESLLIRMIYNRVSKLAK